MLLAIHHIRMISEGSCDTMMLAIQLWSQGKKTFSRIFK